MGEERLMFVQDEDSHWYLIPADKLEAFMQWDEAGPYCDGYEGEMFFDNAIGCSPEQYTFTDPQPRS